MILPKLTPKIWDIAVEKTGLTKARLKRIYAKQLDFQIINRILQIATEDKRNNLEEERKAQEMIEDMATMSKIIYDIPDTINTDTQEELQYD